MPNPPPRRLYIGNQGGEVAVTRLQQRARSTVETEDTLTMWEIDGAYRALDAMYSPGVLTVNLTAQRGDVRADYRLAFPIGAIEYALDQAGFKLVPKEEV